MGQGTSRPSLSPWVPLGHKTLAWRRGHNLGMGAQCLPGESQPTGSLQGTLVPSRPSSPPPSHSRRGSRLPLDKANPGLSLAAGVVEQRVLCARSAQRDRHHSLGHHLEMGLGVKALM